MNPMDDFGDMFRTNRDRYEKQMWGRVEDPWLLDNITMTIREGIIGANGFRADYAVVVTWERMAYVCFVCLVCNIPLSFKIWRSTEGYTSKSI